MLVQERTHDTPYLPQEGRVVTRARWEAFAQRLRAHLRFALGLMPELTPAPLRALRAESYRGAGFRVERFALETLPGFYLTGNLFVPETPAGKRAPAMLQPHGHMSGGRLNKPDLLRAIALAQAGVYVLSYDMVGYNDQFQLPHQGEEPLAWRRWSFSRAGLQTWNSLCAFQWLRCQPEIDAERIGCSGISGGGTQTFLLSAVEPRLSCAVPVKMVSSTMQGGCICENAPLLRLFAGNPEIVALTAPRPLLLISDSEDWTRDNPEVVAPYLQRVYRLLGAEAQFQFAHYSEGHEWGTAARQAYYAWIAHLWRLPRVPKDPSVSLEVLSPALRVWGDEIPQPADAPTNDAVFSLYQKHAREAVARWRRFRRYESELREAVLSMLGLEQVQDALNDAIPEVWRGALEMPKATRCVVVFGGASTSRYERKGYRVLRLPELPRPEARTTYAYATTYTLTPDTARARALVGLLLHLKTKASRLAVAAQGEWGALCGLACCVAQVPLEGQGVAESTPLDLPGYERIGGWSSLQLVIRS